MEQTAQVRVGLVASRLSALKAWAAHAAMSKRWGQVIIHTNLCNFMHILFKTIFQEFSSHSQFGCIFGRLLVERIHRLFSSLLTHCSTIVIVQIFTIIHTQKLFHWFIFSDAIIMLFLNMFSVALSGTSEKVNSNTEVWACYFFNSFSTMRFHTTDPVLWAKLRCCNEKTNA